MAHEITERTDGTAEAAFALTPAWHGLGTVLDHPMTSAEAMTAAHLDWLVCQEPIFHQTDQGYTEIPNMMANIRSDNGLALGVVSDRYKVIQNVEGFNFLDTLIENHEMTYESAFSLRGGRQVVLLARLPQEDEIVPEDKLQRYVILSLNHDGTGAVNFGPVSTRVVCSNTYAMAEREGSMRGLSIRHQGSIDDKLTEARRILGLIQDEFNGYAAEAELLARTPFDRLTFLEYLDILCPYLDERDPDYTPRRQSNIEDTRWKIRLAYENERQQTAPRTAWAAFNAVTEHIDHLPRRGATRAQRAETRFNVCLAGPGRDMKRRAFEAAKRFIHPLLAK